MKKLNSRGFKLCRAILGPIFKWYYKPTIINKEVLPKEGPILIVGNHKHLFDQCLAIISTKRVIHYMAKKEYWDSKKTAWFFDLAGCIPVNRQTKDNDAKNAAVEVLKNGGAIGLFPEGTRNGLEKNNGQMKNGATYLALKTGVPILPVGIKGKMKPFSKVTLNFGKPIDYSKYLNEKITKQLEEKTTEELKEKIIELTQ